MDKSAAYVLLAGLQKCAGEAHGTYGNISDSWGKKLLDNKAPLPVAQNYVNSRNKIINWGWNPFDYFYMKNHVKAEQSQEQNMNAYIDKLKHDRYWAEQKAQQAPTQKPAAAPEVQLQLNEK